MVAALILVGTIALGLLKWANETVDVSKQLALKTGLIQSDEERSRRLNEYRLGKAIARRSFYATGLHDIGNPSVVPADIRSSMDNNLAEIVSLSKELGLTADPDHQDFVARVVQDYEYNSASDFYQNSISAKYGETAKDVLRLGLQVESCFWMAIKKEFTRSFMDKSGFPAIETLEGLNEQAKKFGAAPVVEKFATSDQHSLNLHMRMATQDLDRNIMAALGKR